MQKNLIWGISIVFGIGIILLIVFLGKQSVPLLTPPSLIPSPQPTVLPSVPPKTGTTAESDIPEFLPLFNWAKVPPNEWDLSRYALYYDTLTAGNKLKFGNIPLQGEEWRAEKINLCKEVLGLEVPPQDPFYGYHLTELSDKGWIFGIMKEGVDFHASAADGPTGSIEGLLKDFGEGAQVVVWSYGIPLEQFTDFGPPDEPWAGPCYSTDQYKVEYRFFISEITPWSEILKFINAQ